MDPYRTPVTTTIARKARKYRDLWLVFAVVWAFALARVGFGLYRHQTFGVDLTLAAVAVFLIPALLRE